MIPRFAARSFACVLLLSSGCKKPSLDATAMNDSGLAAANKGDVDGALKHYDDAIKLKPDFATAYKNRGVAYASKGDYDHALQDYDQAIKLKPDLASAYNSRALIYQQRGEYPRAIQDFDQALKLKPDYTVATKNRGRARFFLGRYADAAADLRQGAASDSTNAYLPIWLHMANLHLGQNDTQEFTSLMAKADSVQWPAPVAQFYLGKLSADQLLALAAKSDSKTQSDQTCAAAFYIGEQLLSQKKTADARRRFEVAKSSCPKVWTEYQGAVSEIDRLGGK